LSGGFGGIAGSGIAGFSTHSLPMSGDVFPRRACNSQGKTPPLFDDND
jgi:hypothetical protein